MAFFCSCTSRNVINGIPVKFERPVTVMQMDCDRSFTFDFPEVICYGGLQLVNDSILFVYERPHENGGMDFYKAYSLPDFSYLGAHLKKGRGPGEFLAPSFSGHCRSDETENRCDYIFDVVQNMSFAYDFIKSVESGKDIFYTISELPYGTLYASPYCDTLQLIANLENGSMSIRLTDKDMSTLKQIELYPGVSSEWNYNQLCYTEAISEKCGVIAMLMLSIPQINFLDLETGEIESHAVDKAYRRWKDLINLYDIESVMNSAIYYSWAGSTEDYIIATYRNGMTHNDMKNGAKGTHLHIFNWDGDFLYDISLKETISSPVYDPVRKHLYAIDYADEHIYRYNLCGLI
ncbi:MAG: TolB-like 6-bladed beta-propeller domain-containing protein [Bacteroides sp.]|nr:TolB-like 6-bladed beta-propeller domain-containing protein [Bacteroides sp.]